MKKYTKTFCILLATTCLSTVYAMDFEGDAPTSSALAVQGGSGGSSALATRRPMTVSMGSINALGQDLVARVHAADVTGYWTEALGASELSRTIGAIPASSTKDLVSGYHSAKISLSLKMRDAAKAKGKPGENEANSEVGQAQTYLDRLEGQLALLARNGGSLAVAVREVAVVQDERGRGWQVTDVDSDGFNVVVATRRDAFASVAFNETKGRQDLNPLMEQHEVDQLEPVTAIPKKQLQRDYAFLDFFNPGFNPFTGQTNESKDGMFETLNALSRFYDGSLAAELQELSKKVREKAASVRSAAEGRTLFAAIDTIASAIDNILVLLGEGSILGETFRRDIGKIKPAFDELQELCSGYVGTLGIQEKAFPVSGNAHESMFALEKVLVSDIHKVTRHLEKITSILNSKRGEGNPFQRHIDKLSAFIQEDDQFLRLLEGSDLATTIRAINAENAKLSAELPVAKAKAQTSLLRVQEKQEELERDGVPAYLHSTHLRDLEFEHSTAQREVDKLEQRLGDNTDKWISALKASVAAREDLRGFHGAFARQYHVLQTPKVWESPKLEELGTLRQSLTDLNMLVEDLENFYKEAHKEVVKVAAKEGRVRDMRHAPSMLANEATDFKEALLPVAPPLALEDARAYSADGGVGMDGAMVGMPQPGLLARVGLETFKGDGGMSNPLSHLADVARRVDRTRKSTETHAAVIARVQAQTEALKAERTRMKSAAAVVEVRDPLADLKLGVMSLQQVKNVLGVTTTMRGAPYYNIYFSADLVEPLIQKSQATRGAAASTDEKENFVRELADIYQSLSEYVGGETQLRDIFQMYESENFDQLHFEYESTDPKKVGYFESQNNSKIEELLQIFDEYKPRLRK